jgi:hypothetical protein
MAVTTGAGTTHALLLPPPPGTAVSTATAQALDTYCQHLPGVFHCVQLIEMIFAAIPTNLQLRTNLRAPGLHPFCPVQGSQPPLLHYVSGHQVLVCMQLQMGCIRMESIADTARVCNKRMQAAAVCMASWLGLLLARAYSVRGPSFLCGLDAVQDPFEVPFKVHSPLIQAACGQGGQPAPHDCHPAR